MYLQNTSWYKCIYLHMCTYVFTYVYICIYICVHMCTYVFTYQYISKRMTITFTSRWIATYMYLYTSIFFFTYTCIYICHELIHTHVYICFTNSLIGTGTIRGAVCGRKSETSTFRSYVAHVEFVGRPFVDFEKVCVHIYSICVLHLRVREYACGYIYLQNLVLCVYTYRVYVSTCLYSYAFTCRYVHIHVCIHIQTYTYTLIARTPPPGMVSYLLCSRIHNRV